MNDFEKLLNEKIEAVDAKLKRDTENLNPSIMPTKEVLDLLLELKNKILEEKKENEKI